MIDFIQRIWPSSLSPELTFFYVLGALCVFLEVLPLLVIRIEIPEGMIYLSLTIATMLLLAAAWPAFLLGLYCFYQLPDGALEYAIGCWRARRRTVS